MKGLSFLSALSLVFIVLKLVGSITWPWWVVLSPIWGMWALAALLLLPVGIWWIAIGTTGRARYKLKRSLEKKLAM
jgi:hypothetical protein